MSKFQHHTTLLIIDLWFEIVNYCLRLYQFLFNSLKKAASSSRWKFWNKNLGNLLLCKNVDLWLCCLDSRLTADTSRVQILTGASCLRLLRYFSTMHHMNCVRKTTVKQVACTTSFIIIPFSKKACFLGFLNRGFLVPQR